MQSSARADIYESYDDTKARMATVSAIEGGTGYIQSFNTISNGGEPLLFNSNPEA